MNGEISQAAQLKAQPERTQIADALSSRLQKQMGEALKIVGGISDDAMRAKTLIKLMPSLPRELNGEALTLAQGIKDDHSHGQVLQALAPRLSTVEQRDAALEQIAKLHEPAPKFRALEAQAKSLTSDDQQARALKVAAKLDGLNASGFFQRKIAQQLPVREQNSSQQTIEGVKLQKARSIALESSLNGKNPVTKSDRGYQPRTSALDR
jgi:hypothetical protein